MIFYNLFGFINCIMTAVLLINAFELIFRSEVNHCGFKGSVCYGRTIICNINI